jgi:isochorismate synthase
MAELFRETMQEAIDTCVEQELPFVFYRLPGSNEIHFIGETYPGTIVESESPGLIFSPFQPDGDANTWFIRKDNHFAGKLEDFAGLHFDIRNISGEDMANTKATREEFCQQVEKAVKAIKNGTFDKVILSRVEKVSVEDKNPLAIFMSLCKRYNSAFVALVVIPGETVWLTASPELLVSLEGDTVKTVALAGTKPASDNIAWGEKEKAEQQMVVDYVHKVLVNNCTDVQMSGPVDAIAGNIAHLKTEFTATLSTGMVYLLEDLHPTPAVCGLPKNKALEFITKTELHKRKYYTGYLGPCNMNGKTEWYVNLRCAELFPDRANLYIGGGITADSVPEKEWNETIMKAQTLLSVMAPTLKVV